MVENIRERVANIIAAELLKQDYVDDPAPLGETLSLAWIDQGETDIGVIADAVLAYLQEIGYGR